MAKAPSRRQRSAGGCNRDGAKPSECCGKPGVDAMFKAFSDTTRLRILHLLLGGEMCVGDVATILEAPQPRASQHLACLRSAGLVTCRRNGLWSFYSLSTPRSNFHKKLLECLKHCFAEVPELQADERRAANLAKSAACCPTATSQRGGKRSPG